MATPHGRCGRDRTLVLSWTLRAAERADGFKGEHDPDRVVGSNAAPRGLDSAGADQEMCVPAYLGSASSSRG